MKFTSVVTSRNSVKLQIWNVWQEFREDEKRFPRWRFPRKRVKPLVRITRRKSFSQISKAKPVDY